MATKDDAVAALEELRQRIEDEQVPLAVLGALMLAVLGIVLRWIAESEGRTSMGRLLFTQEIAADQVLDAIMMAIDAREGR